MHDTNYETSIQGAVTGAFPLIENITVKLVGSLIKGITDYFDKESIPYNLNNEILTFSMQVEIKTPPNLLTP